MKSNLLDPLRDWMSRHPRLMHGYLTMRLKFSIAMLRLMTLPCRRCNRHAKPRLLVLRPDHLGDTLISTGIFRFLTEKFHSRGFECEIVVNQVYAPLLSDLDFFDHVTAIDTSRFKSDWRYRLGFYCRMAAIPVAVTVDLVAVNSLRLSPLAIRGRFYARRWKSISDYENILSEIVLKQCAAAINVSETAPIFEQEAALAAAAAGSPCPPQMMTLDRLIPHLPKSSLDKKTCLVAPGAADMRRAWPPENWAALLQRVHRAFPELKLVLTGTDSEAALLHGIAEMSGVACSVRSGVDIRQFMSDVRQAGVVIGNDSGIQHIAAGFDIPSLGIVGGGTYGVFLPTPYYRHSVAVGGKFRKCFYCNMFCRIPGYAGGRLPCIEEISVEQVWQALDQLLKRTF